MQKKYKQKKTKSKKEPYKNGIKKIPTKEKKKIYMERYHKDKRKGISKTRKNPKLAKKNSQLQKDIFLKDVRRHERP